MANEDFNVETADAEFSDYVKKLKDVIRGLELDFEEFHRYKVESEHEFDEFNAKLKRHLKNSRDELDSLINDIS